MIRRKGLMLIFVLVGVVLLFIDRACTGEIEHLVTVPSAASKPGATADGMVAPQMPGLELPADPESLRDACDVLRRFLALYASYTNRTDLVDRTAQLRDLTNPEAGELLAASENLARAAIQNGLISATGTESSLQIRLLAASSIQFLATVNQTLTRKNGSSRSSVTYAVTLVRDDSWKVDSLERANSGDSGSRGHE
jgi:hypothetical protein